MPRPPGLKNRPFPAHSLKDALPLVQTIRDQNAGQPMNRLLLADAMKMSPSGSPFKKLIASSFKYGLTKGGEKAPEIAPTEIGLQASGSDQVARQTALRKAARTPPLFERFYTQYDQAKLPSDDMRPKILVTQYEVPEEWAQEGSELVIENGRFAGLIRDITGGPRVMLDAAPTPTVEEETGDGQPVVEGAEIDASDTTTSNGEVVDEPALEAPKEPPSTEGHVPKVKPIFVGHGKKKGPLEKIERFLIQFGIPHKVAQDEPNLGRPIPTKVREVMKECGSSILIFTKDEKFLDGKGNDVWRPSENVVYELGAASFEYENRIVILMEEGLNFPANFESIGHISFEEDAIEAKTAALLQELIGFGLVKVTPTG
jgi:predicted nucleotide-binding protein